MKTSNQRIHTFKSFMGPDHYLKSMKRTLVPEIHREGDLLFFNSISDVFDAFQIHDGMTLSFHHHLRNGDGVLNLVLEEIKRRGLKDMVLAPSAIFPVHEPMVELIQNGQINDIYTNYVNGPVAEAISHGYLKGLLVMDTHGGRPRAIESGELIIDVAFIASPAADKSGHGNGLFGPSACGALGYAIADLIYAKTKILITDHLVDQLDRHELDGKYVHGILNVPSIGDPKGILSGTTRPTTDPVQLKIARHTVKLMDALGYLKHGMSFQTGAGGTSIAVASELKKLMSERNIRGGFASGGITSYLVDMQKNGLFERLYDVQCFDLDAVESYRDNPSHLPMSASEYANPMALSPIVNQLDVVILGATEIDLDFNVNVTTDSNGVLMGGSGGHADTAYGAKLTIITTNLFKSRLSMIKSKVTTTTTPGETIDCLVTERGIAINPKRRDLIEKLKDSHLPIVSIESLYQQALHMTGVPKDIIKHPRIVGVIRYRDGSIIDQIRQIGDI